MPPGPTYLGLTFWGIVMTAVSITSMRSVSETQADASLTKIALFSFLGLVASLCLAAVGVDVAAGLF
jgi:hypothetical protein